MYLIDTYVFILECDVCNTDSVYMFLGCDVCLYVYKVRGQLLIRWIRMGKNDWSCSLHIPDT